MSVFVLVLNLITFLLAARGVCQSITLIVLWSREKYLLSSKTEGLCSSVLLLLTSVFCVVYSYLNISNLIN